MFQIITTTDTEHKAKALAQLSLSKKLAACAQISGPISSLYPWNGRIQEESEWKIDFKTTDEKTKSLMQLIEENHSYEIPEIIVTKIVDISPNYKKWIFDTLSLERGAGAEV